MLEGRDIIVIGGSAGALQAVRSILAHLPGDFPAAVFLVIHRGEESPGFLSTLLAADCRLRVREAGDGQPIELGTLSIAPIDRHLLIKPGETRVIRGPRENGFRPAIDPLFRTAANTYGPRVVAILLSGGMDDGVHGMLDVKRRGGLTIAQSPDDAQEPSMPSAAIERVAVDYVRTAAEIGPLLEQILELDSKDVSSPGLEQADVSEGLTSALRLEGVQKACSPFVCPDCGGPLWERHDGGGVRYRCHVGHGFTAASLESLHDVEIEQCLWSTVRLLEEQAELQRKMAQRSTPDMAKRYSANSREREQMADLIRGLLNPIDLPLGGAKQSPAIRREYTG